MEEGEVVVGFAVAASGDAAFGFQRPGFDLAGAQGVFELFGVVAAVGPELAGLDPATGECVQEREQVAAFVFVPGGQPDFERLPVAIDG